MSLAIAVRIAASSVRSIARRARPAAAGADAEVGDERPSRRSPSRRCRARAACRPRSKRVAQLARPRRAAPRGSRPASARAAPPTSSAFISDRAAHVLDHRVEVVLALGEERIEEARGAGVVDRRAPRAPRAGRGGRRRRGPAPRARGRASRPAPGGRTGRRRRGANSHSAPRVARRRSSGSRARARAPAPRPSGPPAPRAPKAIAMSSGSATSLDLARRAARPRAARPIAGSARLPTITGWTNSTATWRTSERAAGERPSATSRPPRAKRSAIRWQQRASRSASASKKRAVRLGARGEQLVDAAPSRRRRAGPPNRRRTALRPSPRRGPATPVSHSRHSSTPSPVLALTSIALDPGIDRVEVVRGSGRGRSRGAGAGRSC